jgi:hypothetical protein
VVFPVRENEEQYVTNLRNNIQKIHEIARKTLKTAQETMKRAMIPK